MSNFTSSADKARSADGSVINRGGDLGVSGALRDGATPYTSPPDYWKLNLGEILPNTSVGLKRQRRAKMCGLAKPGAMHHYEFTDRDVWPEYTPEASAAVARRWTGATLDGYMESAEPREIRDKGWTANLQRATMQRAGELGFVREGKAGESNWLRKQRPAAYVSPTAFGGRSVTDWAPAAPGWQPITLSSRRSPALEPALVGSPQSMAALRRSNPTESSRPATTSSGYGFFARPSTSMPTSGASSWEGQRVSSIEIDMAPSGAQSPLLSRGGAHRFESPSRLMRNATELQDALPAAPGPAFTGPKEGYTSPNVNSLTSRVQLGVLDEDAANRGALDDAHHQAANDEYEQASQQFREIIGYGRPASMQENRAISPAASTISYGSAASMPEAKVQLTLGTMHPAFVNDTTAQPSAGARGGRRPSTSNGFAGALGATVGMNSGVVAVHGQPQPRQLASLFLGEFRPGNIGAVRARAALGGKASAFHSGGLANAYFTGRTNAY